MGRLIDTSIKIYFFNAFCASKMASDQKVALLKSLGNIKIYWITYSPFWWKHFWRSLKSMLYPTPQELEVGPHSGPYLLVIINSRTPCQQTFLCCTVCLVWLALWARDISLWCHPPRIAGPSTEIQTNRQILQLIDSASQEAVGVKRIISHLLWSCYDVFTSILWDIFTS